jgi:hypothetical protein
VRSSKPGPRAVAHASVEKRYGLGPSYRGGSSLPPSQGRTHGFGEALDEYTVKAKCDRVVDVALVSPHRSEWTCVPCGEADRRARARGEAKD